MIVQRLNDHHVIHKFFRCDRCGKELNMGYLSGVHPPKPWESREIKQNGFYLLQHFCPNCKGV